MGMELSNFYQDYSFTPEDFDELQKIYDGVGRDILTYLAPLPDNRDTLWMENARYVPAQFIDIRPAQYDIDTLFTPDDAAVYRALTSVEDRVDMLHRAGACIQLVADRGFRPIDSTRLISANTINSDLERFQVVNLRLWDADENGYEMIPGKDYYIKNNYLYLFDSYAAPTQNERILKMTEICVDMQTVEDILGDNLNLSYQADKISKAEYNEFVRTLTYHAIQGFLQSSVITSLSSLLSIVDKVQVFDKMTTNPYRAAMWQNSDYDLGPFDFVVYFPATLDYYRVSLLATYLLNVRHQYANYQSISYQSDAEIYNRLASSDESWDIIYFDNKEVDEYGVIYVQDTRFVLSGTYGAPKPTGQQPIIKKFASNIARLGDATPKIVLPIPSDEDFWDTLTEYQFTEPSEEQAWHYSDEVMEDKEVHLVTHNQLILGGLYTGAADAEGDYKLLNAADSRLAYATGDIIIPDKKSASKKKKK